MSKLNLENIWSDSEEIETLRQVVDLCSKELSLELNIASDGLSFVTRKDTKECHSGILSAVGQVKENNLVEVELELVRGPTNMRVRISSFFNQLSAIHEKATLVATEKKKGEISLKVKLPVKATPMSMIRTNAFLDGLKQIDELAKTLQEELPHLLNDADLKKLYKEHIDTLEPILPLHENNLQKNRELWDWALETIDFLSSSSSVAVASPFTGNLEYGMAALAAAAIDSGRSLGRLSIPAINSKRLLKLASTAPGTVVVPAIQMGLGSNPYEMGKEMEVMLTSLSSAGTPVLFVGSLEQLQSVFSGGQGGSSDPLLPIVRHIPKICLEDLVLFKVQSAGRARGGLSSNSEQQLVDNILQDLRHCSPEVRKRILPAVVARAVQRRTTSRAGLSGNTFAGKISALSETLAGLCTRPRVQRLADVQERYTKILTNPELLPYLKDHLLAQDRALEQLVSRLTMEALTRPLHQPLRYCAQGTPATGKSESAVLLAGRLGIPYVNIDAASMPDYHTAASQLLGSGRGIVMSHRAGRLEQVAKHHTGVLVEVSDLDHAVPAVRSVLADLFLQVLETGEAQSASGAMFSCANVIFAFTMNLPGGMDETVRKSIGFNSTPSRQEVSSRVISEIKMMLSGAFLSRTGTPILFDPLDGRTLGNVLERAIQKAVSSAAERLGITSTEIIIEEGLGSKVIDSMETSIVSFGARALLEHGRSLAADGFVQLNQENPNLDGKTILVTAEKGGKIRMKIKISDP